MKKSLYRHFLSVSIVAVAAASFSTAAFADSGEKSAKSERAKKVFDSWTAEKIKGAVPRDFVLDDEGYAYVKGKNGKLKRYGNGKNAKLLPKAKPEGKGRGNGGGKGKGPGKGGATDVVTNMRWTSGGDVQTAAGRLLYEVLDNGVWTSYVCSGTVTNDGTAGRTVIITAAHCVYDDVDKVFARNVIFIPNQDGTTGAGTDSDCSNDPEGCWAISFGVVEQNWAEDEFPGNAAWDYGYYVVDDEGSHSGNGTGGALDAAVPNFTVDFTAPYVNDGQSGKFTQDWTHALGYSYANDPYFMYCAEDMTTTGTENWLPSCTLSGGASGGPWIQPMNEANGNGPLISVNSWGYGRLPGMAGPKLNGTTASCLFEASKTSSLALADNTDGQQGVIVDPSGC